MQIDSRSRRERMVALDQDITDPELLIHSSVEASCIPNVEDFSFCAGGWLRSAPLDEVAQDVL